MQNKVIARRKGSMVRYFDARTARMGKWVKAPTPVVPVMSIHGLNRLTVPQLREHAGRYFSVNFTTKTRKAEIVRYILEAQK